jgi:hypothetical protein
MKPHKWAKEIKAWADGAEIEFRTKLYDVWGNWVDDDQPDWGANSDWEYRIKPQHKEPQYLYVYSREHSFPDIIISQFTGYENLIGKIKLEVEDEAT